MGTCTRECDGRAMSASCSYSQRAAPRAAILRLLGSSPGKHALHDLIRIWCMLWRSMTPVRE
eukprot:1587163-Alexandrium_andersonii.AAC.1